MSKQKMLQAQQLIKAKDYDAARKILKTVDHPKARVWEARLDKIAPPKPKARSPLPLILGLVLVLLVIAVAAVLLLNNQPQTDTPAQVAENPTAQATDSPSSEATATQPEATSVPATNPPPAPSEDRPANLPAEFPFPAGGFIQVFDLSSGDEISLAVYNDMSFDDLDTFYREALANAGYEYLDFSTDNTMILSFLGNGTKGNVRLSADGPNGETRISIEMEPSSATSLEELRTGGVGSTASDIRLDSPQAAARAFIDAITSGDSVTALALMCPSNKVGLDESDVNPNMFFPSIPGGEIDTSNLVYTVTFQEGSLAEVEVSGELTVNINVAGTSRSVPVPLEEPVVLELQDSQGWQICAR